MCRCPTRPGHRRCRVPEARAVAVAVAVAVALAEQERRRRAGGPAGKIDINTATAEELTELPRVGPVLAGRIVEFREQHGPYGQPSDLDAVPGIGPVMLETLVELVTV